MLQLVLVESLYGNSLRQHSWSGRSCVCWFGHTLSTLTLRPEEDFAIPPNLTHGRLSSMPHPLPLSLDLKQWFSWYGCADVNNTHFLRTSPTPYKFTQGFLDSPQKVSYMMMASTCPLLSSPAEYFLFITYCSPKTWSHPQITQLSLTPLQPPAMGTVSAPWHPAPYPIAEASQGVSLVLISVSQPLCPWVDGVEGIRDQRLRKKVSSQGKETWRAKLCLW